VTDLAQFRRKDGRLAVEQVAPGFTEEEVLALTGIDDATGRPAPQGVPRTLTSQSTSVEDSP
jgi:acyl CoA:acetate/3-ketoacid CoA transferase beta subunit